MLRHGIRIPAVRNWTDYHRRPPRDRTGETNWPDDDQRGALSLTGGRCRLGRLGFQESYAVQMLNHQINLGVVAVPIVRHSSGSWVIGSATGLIQDSANWSDPGARRRRGEMSRHPSADCRSTPSSRQGSFAGGGVIVDKLRLAPDLPSVKLAAASSNESLRLRLAPDLPSVKL